jgi:hypothetical protein
MLGLVGSNSMAALRVAQRLSTLSANCHTVNVDWPLDVGESDNLLGERHGSALHRRLSPAGPARSARQTEIDVGAATS